jgi:hypothetical protein
LVNIKEPELEPELEGHLVISAPAPGGNLISASQLRLCNTVENCNNFFFYHAFKEMGMLSREMGG